jgi:hypothetical protein
MKFSSKNSPQPRPIKLAENTYRYGAITPHRYAAGSSSPIGTAV